MGELLRSRHRLKSVPGDRQLHRCAVAPAVMVFEDFLDAKRVLGVLGRRSGCATTPSSHTAMWQTEDLAGLTLSYY
jgi:hypothetical protein